jgi:hypothetical protein
MNDNMVNSARLYALNIIDEDGKLALRKAGELC